MKANRTEYRVIVNKPPEQRMMVMVTWEKEQAEAVKEMLHGKSLVFVEIEEVEL
tara:strand:+ start:122 stop:283 length:162 start_codon:yes stop_codon:yes gene_type:complete